MKKAPFLIAAISFILGAAVGFFFIPAAISKIFGNESEETNDIEELYRLDGADTFFK